jgi:hypothetical protein
MIDDLGSRKQHERFGKIGDRVPIDQIRDRHSSDTTERMRTTDNGRNGLGRSLLLCPLCSAFVANPVLLALVPPREEEDDKQTDQRD